jgi:hypothetical protein
MSIPTGFTSGATVLLWNEDAVGRCRPETYSVVQVEDAYAIIRDENDRDWYIDEVTVPSTGKARYLMSLVGQSNIIKSFDAASVAA